MAAPLEKLEVNLAAEPVATVIWLHGLGADGHDFEPIVPELGLPIGAKVRFIFPHAPSMPVTINAGYVMPAWYDIVDGDIGAQQDAEGIRRSQQQVNALIEAEIARGIPAERIVLAGFSQGGAIVLQTGLRYPKRLGGIMVLSSYLPLAATLTSEKDAANTDVAIFYAHGKHDEIIPISLAQQSRQQLEQEGYTVEWHSYPMPHAVVPDEIDDIGRWLKRVLGL